MNKAIQSADFSKKSYEAPYMKAYKVQTSSIICTSTSTQKYEFEDWGTQE